ncbi:MAG TPA: hypothetical protein VFW29_02905 [Solirubrobacteraceae bacterium]|nr:hypothetical protein [Solirubrobacteraceae bacterium]
MGEQDTHGSRSRSRALLSAFWISAGVNHFVNPRAYEAIVPPSLADRKGPVVRVSGVAEVLGGVGVLLPVTRRAAGAALIVLLAAIFPANLYMAREPERFTLPGSGRPIPRWALFARLPLQPLMMWWAWRATRR